MTMIVSAVIPTFNRRNYIKRAIDSILKQTKSVDEIIVVDDYKSTDRIEDFLRELYGTRVVVFKENGGLSGARKRGVREARGQWIAFLDSDDEWEPDRNRQLLGIAASVPAEVAWIFGDLRVVTDSGHGPTLFEEFRLDLKESPHIFHDSLTIQYPFQFGLLQGSIIRRDVLVELNCFSEGLQHSEDLLAGFQVALKHKFAATQSVVGKYFRTSDLNDNSALLKGLNGPDYFLARMLAFESVMRSRRVKRPWNGFYADVTRGLCRVLSKQGESPRRLATQQFRYGGISIKGIAFFFAAMLGQTGLQVWDRGATILREFRVGDAQDMAAANGFRASVRSAGNQRSS